MLIDLDSPLRRLPVSLNRRQALYLDAIRIAAEAADLVYNRLVNTLLPLAAARYEKPERGAAIIGAVADAWIVVDALHRLRVLLTHMPGLKQRSPRLQVFLRATTAIEDLRHLVQHLDREIDKLVELEMPVWGRLHWFVLLDPATATIKSCTITAGTLFEGYHPLQNPVGKDFYANVDYVVLEAGTATANLSEAMRHLEKLLPPLEQDLAAQFKDEPKRGSDMLVTIELTASTEADAQPAPTDSLPGESAAAGKAT